MVTLTTCLNGGFVNCSSDNLFVFTIGIAEKIIGASGGARRRISYVRFRVRHTVKTRSSIRIKREPGYVFVAASSTVINIVSKVVVSCFQIRTSNWCATRGFQVRDDFSQLIFGSLARFTDYFTVGDFKFGRS